jgi:SAM-dependent methyltransferase
MLKNTPLQRGIALAGMLARELAGRPPLLQRRPEPEPAMEDESSVEGFHQAGEALLPVYHFNALAVSRLTPRGGTVLDLGSGSGQFLAYLALARPDIRILGMDLSQAMVNRGRRHLEETGLAGRVSLNQGDMTGFADALPDSVDVVCSVFSLHHLPGREHLLKTLAGIKIARERFGSAAWIFDLLRPRHPGTPHSFPEILTPDTPVVFKEDTAHSLTAAWSYQEMRDGLTEVGLQEARHAYTPVLRFYQTHWMEPKCGQGGGHGHWVDGERSLEVGRVYAKLKWLFPKRPV